MLTTGSKGSLEIGKDADIVVWNPRKRFLLDSKDLYTENQVLDPLLRCAACRETPSALTQSARSAAPLHTGYSVAPGPDDGRCGKDICAGHLGLR